MMQVYLVGGAVRDRLLGLDVRERDWVVVGVSAEAMRAQGYLQVGRDFPVFLHPQTHEEYALARTERKSGPGHLGFICYASPDVTLEQDLQRRDVTINAIAQADDGTLIDPYGGQRDLQQRWLRHIGPAFSEDPLRVLRVARFSACYAPFGFRVAPETHNLMRAMAVSGELDHLTAERIWKETEKALESVAPHVYFTTLHDCQALPILFPELMPLFNVPESIKGQYKLDTAWHPLLVLKQAATLSDDLAVRFAVLCRAFGATWAPYTAGLHHTLPTPVGIPLIKAFCKRLKVPNGLCELALLVTNVYSLVHQVKELSPQAILDLLNTIDVWRRPHRLSQVLLTYRADRQGYEGSSTTAYPQVDYLLHAYECVAAVDVQEIIAAGFSGAAIGKELQQQRLQTLQCWVQATSSTAE